MKAISPRIVLEKDKNYKILSELIKNLGSRTEVRLGYEYLADMKDILSRAKINGYVPNEIYPNATRLITFDKFWDMIEAENDELSWCRTLVNQALKISIDQAYRGLIDFDDQIYMPTLFGGPFPTFPDVMVDEAQDMSRLNHAFLRKLVKGRLFAVGDQRQSIYGFRGAIAGGMVQLRDHFNMTVMNLSVSFRCSKAVVRNALKHAPHMKSPEWAIEGSVQAMESWDAKSIPDGAAIICRFNAPLFALAFTLLRQGRGVKLAGSDIGPALIKAMKKLGSPYMKRSELHDAITKWEQEKIKQAGDKGIATISDKAECFRVFANFGNTLEESTKYAEHIFATQGSITLISGHKSKGLEWDTVYHLDAHRIPSPHAKSEEERAQERNIRYVIETRAKKDLIYITSEGFHE
jgi:superfamily I DNA/RNA helicase